MEKLEVNALTPGNKELIDCVKKAACQYFEVTEQQLIEEHKLASARQCCYYIIKVNTEFERVFDYNIGQFFHRKRTAVQYGVELIDAHKNIYSQVLGNLNGIIKIANNFEKNTHGIYNRSIQHINSSDCPRCKNCKVC